MKVDKAAFEERNFGNATGSKLEQREVYER